MKWSVKGCWLVCLPTNMVKKEHSHRAKMRVLSIILKISNSINVEGLPTG